jgi:hypothetical protein
VIRILEVELQRFAWRRSFRFFGLLALGGIALAAVIVFFNSQPGAEGAQAAAETRHQMIVDCTRFMRQEQLPRGYATVEEFCADTGPPVEAFDPRFHLTTLTDIFSGTSVPLIILGLAFGASFIGAEWHAGTVTPLLTWAPRRVRVFMGKVAAAMIGVVLSALAMQAILGLALWLVAALRGTTEGADLAWLGDTAAVAARGAIIAGLAAVLGFAIASVARNTTVALIIGFVYFAVAESLIRGLRPGWQPWLVGDNAAAFVIGDPADVFAGSGPDTAVGALLVVVAYAALAVAAATAWFESRDVT